MECEIGQLIYMMYIYRHYALAVSHNSDILSSKLMSSCTDFFDEFNPPWFNPIKESPKPHTHTEYIIHILCLRTFYFLRGFTCSNKSILWISSVYLYWNVLLLYIYTSLIRKINRVSDSSKKYVQLDISFNDKIFLLCEIAKA